MAWVWEREWALWISSVGKGILLRLFIEVAFGGISDAWDLVIMASWAWIMDYGNRHGVWVSCEV
jgi:hypothetical protein